MQRQSANHPERNGTSPIPPNASLSKQSLDLRVLEEGQWNSSAVQFCHKYQTITTLAITCSATTNKPTEISTAAADIFGISITIPATAIKIVARRAWLFSFNSPIPTMTATAAQMRNM